MQRGGGEGQVHREEVAGVYQELARSLPVLVLQPPLWGQWSHQDCPSVGVSKQGSPRAPLTSTLLMKRGLTRSSSPAAGAYARRSFTTCARGRGCEQGRAGHILALLGTAWSPPQGSPGAPRSPRIRWMPSRQEPQPSQYLLGRQHRAEAAESSGVLLCHLLHLQQLGSLDQGLQLLAGPALLQPLRPQPLLHLADVVPARDTAQSRAQATSRHPQGQEPQLQEHVSFLRSRQLRVVLLMRKMSWRRAWWPTLGASPWWSRVAQKEPRHCSSLGRVWAGAEASGNGQGAGGGQALDGLTLQHGSNKGYRKLIVMAHKPPWVVPQAARICSGALCPSWEQGG